MSDWHENHARPKLRACHPKPGLPSLRSVQPGHPPMKPALSPKRETHVPRSPRYKPRRRTTLFAKSWGMPHSRGTPSPQRTRTFPRFFASFGHEEIFKHPALSPRPRKAKDGLCERQAAAPPRVEHPCHLARPGKMSVPRLTEPATFPARLMNHPDRFEGASPNPPQPNPRYRPATRRSTMPPSGWRSLPTWR